MSETGFSLCSVTTRNWENYLLNQTMAQVFLYLDSHLVEEMTSVADFIVGPLKLRLQFIHPFLTLLQLTLETQNTTRFSTV